MLQITGKQGQFSKWSSRIFVLQMQFLQFGQTDEPLKVPVKKIEKGQVKTESKEGISKT